MKIDFFNLQIAELPETWEWSQKTGDLQNAWCNSKAYFSLLTGWCLVAGSCINDVSCREGETAVSRKHQEITFRWSLADTIRQWPLLHMLSNTLHSAKFRSIHSIRQSIKPGSLGSACSLRCCFLPALVVVTQCGSFISPEPCHSAMIYLSNNEQQASSACV